MTHIKLFSIVKKYVLNIFLVFLFINSYAFATVTQIKKLSFGSIVVLDNTTTSNITVDLQGRVIPTNKIAIIELGHPASFVLSDFPTYTELFTVASVLHAQTSSNFQTSQQFTLINATTAPSVTTNVAGIAEVIIGGTLQTSGNGLNQYYDDEYTAIIQLTISY